MFEQPSEDHWASACDSALYAHAPDIDALMAGTGDHHELELDRPVSHEDLFSWLQDREQAMSDVLQRMYDRNSELLLEEAMNCEDYAPEALEVSRQVPGKNLEPENACIFENSFLHTFMPDSGCAGRRKAAPACCAEFGLTGTH
jgi:hypothetical protein